MSSSPEVVPGPSDEVDEPAPLVELDELVEPVLSGPSVSVPDSAPEVITGSLVAVDVEVVDVEVVVEPSSEVAPEPPWSGASTPGQPDAKRRLTTTAEKTEGIGPAAWLSEVGTIRETAVIGPVVAAGPRAFPENELLSVPLFAA